MYVTARERKLIEILLEAPQDLPVKEIAETLDVSTRTVHRDLKGIEGILESHQLFLEKQTGKGVWIKGRTENKQLLKKAIHTQKSLDYTPEERHILILSWLLESREPLKLLTLANDLGVTVATISHDLDSIEEVLSKFHLQLIRKRGYGVEVIGEEAHIREAIQYIMMQHMSEHDFLKLLRDQMSSESSSRPVDTVSDHLLGLVNKEKITKIEQAIESQRLELNYPLADSAYIGLVIHLALAMERLQQGEFIQMEEDYLQKLRITKEYEVAKKIIDRLESLLELTIPEAEIGYITMHLMGAKARYNQGFIIEESSLSIAFKTKQLIEFVSKALQIDLHRSDQLLNDLVVHLKPSLYRIQQRMDIKNPLTEQIERDYTDLYQILEDAVKEVFPTISFPKEETAFLVMHFASALLNLESTKKIRVLVVCSSGIGTAKILAAKLKRQFHEIEEVEHRSLFDLDHLSETEYDLIVSTLPLESQPEYVLVNPMLSTSDLHHLQHRIRKVRIMESMKKIHDPDVVVEDQTLQSIRDSVNSIQSYVTMIGSLLNGLYVYYSSFQEKEEVLLETCRQLMDEGTMKDATAVCKALLQRETVGGIGLPSTRITLYHTRHPSVQTPTFASVNLPAPVRLEGMDGEPMDSDVFIVLLAPIELSKEGLEVVSFMSSLLIEDPESVRVLESKDEKQIKKYLSNQLHQLMKEKLPS